MEPEIKVTRIGGRYHARCFLNSEIVDEMACENKQDIGIICRTMLRWLNKMSLHISAYTENARARSNMDKVPKGKIWYRNQLISVVSKEDHNA